MYIRSLTLHMSEVSGKCSQQVIPHKKLRQCAWDGRPDKSALRRGRFRQEEVTYRYRIVQTSMRPVNNQNQASTTTDLST